MRFSETPFGKFLLTLLRFIWRYLLKPAWRLITSKWLDFILIFLLLFGCQTVSNIFTNFGTPFSWKTPFAFFSHIQWNNLAVFASCSFVYNFFMYLREKRQQKQQESAEVKRLKEDLNAAVSSLMRKFEYASTAICYPIFDLVSIEENVPLTVKWIYHNLLTNQKTVYLYLQKILSTMVQAVIQFGNTQQDQFVAYLYLNDPKNYSGNGCKLKFIQLGPDHGNLHRNDLNFEKNGYVDSDGNTILPGGPKAVVLRNYQYIPDTSLPEYGGLFDSDREKSILAIPVFEKEIYGEGEVFAVIYFVCTVPFPFGKDQNIVDSLVIPAISPLMALLKHLHNLGNL